MKAYAIADWTGTPSPALLQRVARISRAGADLIQLRGRDIDDADLLQTADSCRASLGSGTEMIVSRRADIAAAARADGVHLPAAGLPAAAVRVVAPQLVIGRSCHSLEECRRARDEAVDYLLVGPVFHVRSKQKSAAWSAPDLDRACALGPPVFVVGGMSAERIAELAGRGIAGIAAITMYMDDEPLEEIVAEVHAW